MNNVERELKMLLTKTEYESLLAIGQTEPQLQINYYFYCEEMPADVMVRIRVKNGEYLFCYKRLLSAQNGVNVCDEREKPIDALSAKRWIEHGVTEDEIKNLINVDMPATLKCLGSLNTYRAKFVLNGFNVELDKNEYLDVTDYELECECDDSAQLEELKAYLCDNYGVTFKPSLPKSARFFKKLHSK